MPRDGNADQGDPANRVEADYLTFSNIRYLIEQHLEQRSLMLDVQTRFLLSRLRETAEAGADRTRAQLDRREPEDEG
mgnify:CR=1 FL=1